MPRAHRVTCIVCGRHEDEAGQMSTRGKCPDCGEQAVVDSHRQMSNRSGPVFEHWRQRIAASVGAEAPPASRRAPPLTKD